MKCTKQLFQLSKNLIKSHSYVSIMNPKVIVKSNVNTNCYFTTSRVFVKLTLIR